MKQFRLLLGLILLAACNNIRTDYDTGIDFTQYKSFCWLEGCLFTFTGPSYLNDSLVQSRVKEAIIGSMQNKGLRYDDDQPDLLVDFHITIENEKAIYYHGIQDDPYYYRTTFLQPEEVNLTKGSLLIHIVDREKGEVIWQSQAVGYLDTPPDLSEKNIRKGIRKVLKDFPPGK
jgi:hypothetical protein